MVIESTMFVSYRIWIYNESSKSNYTHAKYFPHICIGEWISIIIIASQIASPFKIYHTKFGNSKIIFRSWNICKDIWWWMHTPCSFRQCMLTDDDRNGIFAICLFTRKIKSFNKILSLSKSTTSKMERDKCKRHKKRER